MDLVNGIIPSRSPSVPRSISKRLTLTTTCTFTPREIHLFSLAFRALEIGLLQTPSLHPDLYATVIFTDKDTVEIKTDSEHLGNWVPIIIYSMHRIRSKRYSDAQFMAITLEELCHCFWAIRDEKAVQDKVMELLHLMLPNVQKSDVYNPNWTPDERK